MTTSKCACFKKDAPRRLFGSLRVLPSGAHQARYIGPDGHTYKAPSTFSTHGDAETYLNMIKAGIDRARAAGIDWQPPDAPRPAALTFGEYAERWLANRELRPRTREHYRKVLDTLVLPRLRDEPLPKITATLIIDWHGKLRTGKTYKAHAYSVVRAIMRTAVLEKLIDASPCTIPGAGRSPKRKITPRVLPNDELRALVEAMPEEYALMVPMAAWLTTRFGEAAALTRGDIDLRNKVLHVRRAVTFVGAEAIVGPPKSAEGVRDVDIPDAIMPAIRLHLRKHVALNPDALLFPGPNGGYLRHATFMDLWHKARETAGLPHLRYHDLRHHGLTSAAIVGASLREIMARGGHSTVSAAMVYQSVAKDRGKEIAARLSEIAEK